MQQTELNVQASRLSIIIWISFCIALFYFMYFTAELLSPSLAEELKNLPQYNTNQRTPHDFIKEISAFETRQTIHHILGLLSASLFLISVPRIQLKKTKSERLYLLATYTCIIYNLLQFTYTFTSSDQNKAMEIGGKPNTISNIQEYLIAFFQNINFGTNILFISLSLIYLVFNIFFIKHPKTKHLFQLFSTSEE